VADKEGVAGWLGQHRTAAAGYWQLLFSLLGW